MCGIVGMITTDNKSVIDKRKFMRQALIIDTLRGDDSTGIFYKNRENEGDAGWYKAVVDGYQFVETDDYEKIAQKMGDYWFMVGHNRAATVGAVDVKGAHPFQESGVTLVHNGTLRGTYDLPKSQHQLGVGVDSHALCHNIALVEPDAVGEEVISKINGAFTLIWHDSRDGSLNIVRNDERPLHIAQSMLHDTLYFTSEAKQLMWLNERITLGIGDVFYPEPGVHLKFFEGSLKPTVQEYDLRPKQVYSRGYSGGSGYDRAPYAGADYYDTGYWNGVEWVEYDDESYAYARPKAQPRQDNRVHVGGRRREIPQLSQWMLLNNDLVIEDRLLFSPLVKHTKEWLSGNVDYSYVVGRLETTGQTAVIYHMETNAVTSAWNRRWLVRPVAMNCEIVVCKLVQTVANGEDVSWAADPLKAEIPEQSTIPGTEQCTELRAYEGPDGKWLDKQEWLVATSEGCVVCEVPLSLENSHEVVWYMGDFPMCGTCGADANEMDELDRDLPF